MLEPKQNTKTCLRSVHGHPKCKVERFADVQYKDGMILQPPKNQNGDILVTFDVIDWLVPASDVR